VLRPGLAAWRRSQDHADLQGNALLALHALSHAIAAADDDSISLYPHRWTHPDSGEQCQNDALVLFSPYDANGAMQAVDGRTSWQSVDVYYLDTEQAELWSASIELSAIDGQSSPSVALPPVVVSSLQSGAPVPPYIGRHRRVARYVRSLSLSGAGESFRVRVETAQDETRCSIETAITPILTVFSGDLVHGRAP
jgi:hypothetical protein